MPLTPGSVNANGEFVESDSLALSIDNALPNRPAFGQRERRELLVAIAKGVINYLKAHQDSFKIAVTVSATSHTGTGTLTIE